MTSQKLCSVRKYEIEAEKKIVREDRPVFHMSARTGWLNDPNGFTYYNGMYHVFYQYHPYDPYWGPMHWGHAASSDLLHWKYLPAAMAPDENYDKDGCFSGSAVTLPDGRQMLMYTGVQKEISENGNFYEIQTQCLAIGDGWDYEKYSGNPVIDEKDLPKGSSKSDFRDPKIWQKKDGTYYCVAGNRSADGSGQILLFTSPDGLNWRFKKVLTTNNRDLGTMWECPDFFELDGKWVLMISAMEMKARGYEYPEGNVTVSLIGDFDEETEVFTVQNDQSVDQGIDFYAPQTMLTPDGRRIMIGWMLNPVSGRLHSQEEPWFGQLSLPRELFVRNGRLYQQPVRELETMRCGKIEYRDVIISEKTRLEGIRGRKADLELTLSPHNDQNIYEKFSIYFAQNGRYYTSLCFYPEESRLEIDRQFAGNQKDIIDKRSCLVNSVKGKLKLRIILDQFSAEVFVNDGEQSMTTTIFTEQSADDISFFAEGRAVINVVKYELK